MTVPDDVRVGLVSVDQVQFHPHNVRTNLGDLRPLAASIKKYGVLQPLVVERRGEGFRLRAGHRRLAAAKIAGLGRVPAVIHSVVLDERSWLEQAVQENVMRSDMDKADRRRTIQALRRLGCGWDGIGETFGVAGRTARSWATDDDENGINDQRDRSKSSRGAEMSKARQRAVKRLIEAHRDEYEQLLTEEGYSRLKREPGGSQVQTRRERLVEDVAKLLGYGESAHAIALRLGRSATAIERALQRAQRHDLAKAFGRVNSA